MEEQLYDQVIARLTEAHNILVITHLRPDADAIGSATALVKGLRRLGKDARAVIGQRREISRNLLSIPGAEDVELVDTLPQGYDLYVTVDCGSIDRTGSLAPELADVATQDRLLVIDHHASNVGFGSTNLIDVDAESTTTILDELLDRMSVPADKDIAHCLYAGLVTDTGSFRWGRPVMHDLAARLMSYGLDTKRIAEDLLDSTTDFDLQMVGRVLANVSVIPAGNHTAAVLVASHADIAGHSDAAVESLVDFVRALEGTDVGVVFKGQTDTVWAVSLRSSVIDCAELAVKFGGGGHVPAAGYITTGTPDDVVAEVVAALTAMD